MVINFRSKKKKIVKKKTSTFLYFPIFFDNTFFWLERVIVKKSFNGNRLQITDIIRAKDLINKEIRKNSKGKIRSLQEAI